MEYRVPGSLEVRDRSGHRLPLGGARQHAVLPSLVLRAGRTVSVAATNRVRDYVSRSRLADFERRMLGDDAELEPDPGELPVPAEAIAEPPLREPVRARRPTTVVFADVVDSTTLGELHDPESVHRILERYSDIAQRILGGHGGEIEKFIGDAVVAFFGLTEVHEDDALRAVRAAIELRDAVAELRDELVQSSGIELAVSIGVNSGDVFVGGGAGRETFATGDAVNVAARLEQEAEAWEILLGDRTYRLVEAEVRAEALEPLAVKGRSAAVRAWRLLDLATPSKSRLARRHRSWAGGANRKRFEKPSHGRTSSRRASSARSSGRRESGRRASRVSWSRRPVEWPRWPSAVVSRTGRQSPTTR
jgi:class 3 adenylate cyclase